MHLYIITRGNKHQSDRFITQLQGKYFNYKFPDKDGNLQPCAVQCGVRPIQLWEIVFPEENKDIVLNSFFEGNSLEPQHKKHKKFIWGLRKMLGVKEVKSYDKNSPKFPIFHNDVEINVIGVKDDWFENPKTKKRYYNPTEAQKKECWEGL